MGRLVCFIDEDGQVGTCINFDNEGDCDNCEHNNDVHKKWRAEIDATLNSSHTGSIFKGKYTLPDDASEPKMLKDIRTHNIKVNLDFIDQDIIIYAEASSEGIEIFGTTRCFDDLDKLECDANCPKCPYEDKTKQEEIFRKWEEPLVEIMRELYKKIEVMR